MDSTVAKDPWYGNVLNRSFRVHLNTEQTGCVMRPDYTTCPVGINSLTWWICFIIPKRAWGFSVETVSGPLADTRLRQRKENRQPTTKTLFLNDLTKSCRLSNTYPTANKDYAISLVLRECTRPSGCAPLEAPTNPPRLAGAFLLPLLAVSATGHMSKESCRSRVIGVSYSFTNVGASITAKSRELTSMNAGSAWMPLKISPDW